MIEVKIEGLPDNPNEYDDAAYTAVTASLDLQGALSDLWDAGASADDLQGEIANALGDLG